MSKGFFFFFFWLLNHAYGIQAVQSNFGLNQIIWFGDIKPKPARFDYFVDPRWLHIKESNSIGSSGRWFLTLFILFFFLFLITCIIILAFVFWWFLFQFLWKQLNMKKNLIFYTNNNNCNDTIWVLSPKGRRI